MGRIKSDFRIDQFNLHGFRFKIFMKNPTQKFMSQSVWIVSSHSADWEPDSFESQSQINSSTALWETDKSLCLTSTEQSFVDEKIFTAGIRMAFFTIILTILLLFLQIIVLRAYIEGCQFISDSIKLYFPPFSIDLCIICSCYIYNSFTIFLINKQMKYNILQSFLNNSLYSFYLLPSIFLLKSQRRSLIINRPQMQILTVQLFHIVDYFTGWASEY